MSSSKAALRSRRSSISRVDSLTWLVDAARLASAFAARASEAASCSRSSSFSSAESFAWVAARDSAAASCSRRASFSDRSAAVDEDQRRLLTKAFAGDSADVASSRLASAAARRALRSSFSARRSLFCARGSLSSGTGAASFAVGDSLKKKRFLTNFVALAASDDVASSRLASVAARRSRRSWFLDRRSSLSARSASAVDGSWSLSQRKRFLMAGGAASSTWEVREPMSSKENDATTRLRMSR